MQALHLKITSLHLPKSETSNKLISSNQSLSSPFAGYGHLAPSTVGGRVFCMIFALFGIPLNLMVLRHIGDRVNQVISYIHYFVETKLLHQKPEVVATKTLIWTLVVLILMLFVGAVLYLQEEQWNFLEGVYFCFITFSTIGFGDLVPNGGKECILGSSPHGKR